MHVRRRLIQISFSAVCVLTVVACRETPTRTDYVTLTLRTDASAVAPGDDLQSTLAIINRGERPVSLTGERCMIRFDVIEASSGVPIQHESLGDCDRDVLWGVTIPPGDSLMMVNVWQVPMDVTAGSYRVRATVRAFEGYLASPAVPVVISTSTSTS
jgi:hypothetical protein